MQHLIKFFINRNTFIKALYNFLFSQMVRFSTLTQNCIQDLDLDDMFHLKLRIWIVAPVAADIPDQIVGQIAQMQPMHKPSQ